MKSANEIKMIVLDVDGVLTDGSILVDDDGREHKRFYVRDGFAMKAAVSLGLKVGVITGRASRSVTSRMNELGVEFYMHRVKDKGAAIEAMAAKAGVAVNEIAYVGDDLIDLPAMRRCGYPMAVGDAAEEVRAAAVYVTQNRGGRGAVREAIEHLLKAQGKWAELTERYR